MPNGGSSNCRSCKHNKANQQGNADSNYPTPAPAYCLLRDTDIQNPLWTYCLNYYSEDDVSEGPIYSAGIEDHNRVPWLGRNQPKISPASHCHICEMVFETGLIITDRSGIDRQFCSDRHYVQWWKKENPLEVLKWDIDKG